MTIFFFTLHSIVFHPNNTESTEKKKKVYIKQHLRGTRCSTTQQSARQNYSRDLNINYGRFEKRNAFIKPTSSDSN